MRGAETDDSINRCAPGSALNVFGASHSAQVMNERPASGLNRETVITQPANHAMKNSKSLFVQVVALLLFVIVQPARAQWNQNSSSNTFSYTATANWNG